MSCVTSVLCSGLLIVTRPQRSLTVCRARSPRTIRNLISVNRLPSELIQVTPLWDQFCCRSLFNATSTTQELRRYSRVVHVLTCNRNSRSDLWAKRSCVYRLYGHYSDLFLCTIFRLLSNGSIGDSSVDMRLQLPSKYFVLWSLLTSILNFSIEYFISLHDLVCTSFTNRTQNNKL